MLHFKLELAQEVILKSEKKIITKSTTPTHLQTKELIESSSSLEELAKSRGMSKGTIINHLRILKEQDSGINFDKFMPDKETIILVKEAVVKIKKRNNKDDFSEDGQIRLKPIFEALDSKLQYDAIKIALL